MAIRYLLDTNICIYIAKHNPPAVRARFEQLSSDALAMSVVTLGELQHGAEKSQARDKALVCCSSCKLPFRLCPWHPLPVHITARSAPPWSAPGSPLATTTCGLPPMHAPRAGCW